MDKNFWREYFSIPNIMGYFRIALAMLYMLLFYRALDGAPYWPVIVTIVISGITDFFDGKIARRFNMITDWGKMLDPIADKITLGAIIISMSFKYSIVIPMVVFYIIKEGYMAVAGIISIRAGHKIEAATASSVTSSSTLSPATASRWCLRKRCSAAACPRTSSPPWKRACAWQPKRACWPVTPWWA